MHLWRDSLTASFLALLSRGHCWNVCPWRKKQLWLFRFFSCWLYCPVIPICRDYLGVAAMYKAKPSREAPTPSPKIISISSAKNEPQTSPLYLLVLIITIFPFCYVDERGPALQFLKYGHVPRHPLHKMIQQSTKSFFCSICTYILCKLQLAASQKCLWTLIFFRGGKGGMPGLSRACVPAPESKSGGGPTPFVEGGLEGGA